MQQHLASSCGCAIVFAFPEATVPESAWIIYLIQANPGASHSVWRGKVGWPQSIAPYLSAEEADKLKKGTEYETVLAVDDNKSSKCPGLNCFQHSHLQHQCHLASKPEHLKRRREAFHIFVKN